MDGMTNPAAAVPQPILDAIEALVQERVTAALAAEKHCRLAERVKLEGEAHRQGYAVALTDMEQAWSEVMARLWSGRREEVLPAQWPWGRQPSEHDLMLREQGCDIEAPVEARVVQFSVVQAPPPPQAPAAPEPAPEPEPPAAEPAEDAQDDDSPAAAASANPPIEGLDDWPPAAINVLRRQWPRYVTEPEIQAEIEDKAGLFAARWKLPAQAKRLGLERPPMPRAVNGSLEVTWHQAAMLARQHGLRFDGDLMPLNKKRDALKRPPCILIQPNGPTAEDLAAYGPATK